MMAQEQLFVPIFLTLASVLSCSLSAQEPEYSEQDLDRLFSLDDGFKSGEDRKIAETKGALEFLRKKAKSSERLWRARAALVLRHIKTSESVQIVAPLLADNDEIVAQRAADALGGIGRKEALPHLIKALTPDKMFLSQSVIKALVALGGDEARAAIEQFVQECDKAIAGKQYLKGVAEKALKEMQAPKKE